MSKKGRHLAPKLPVNDMNFRASDFAMKAWIWTAFGMAYLVWIAPSLVWFFNDGLVPFWSLENAGSPWIAPILVWFFDDEFVPFWSLENTGSPLLSLGFFASWAVICFIGFFIVRYVGVAIIGIIDWLAEKALNETHHVDDDGNEIDSEALKRNSGAGPEGSGTG